ncbi:MAG TPA: DeoR/GlpR family DNA-binding transcription regulator [Patescibacteria group bacterium]|nr:DeoR/GlpR family DNA-binding transcription regulator [Patescibacteria group bacterium]
MWNVLHDDDSLAPGHEFAARRRQRLGLIVDARRAVRLEELSAALGVSQATVRRDLDALAATGRLRRVHGGAVAVDERLDEPPFDAKAGAAAAEKLRIAARAVELLEQTDTVYLDSGSTILAAARLLHGWSRLTVVTNSLPAASELVGRGPRLIVIGGELRTTSRALVGPLTRLVLEDLHVDRALMGTFALSLEDGLTTTDPSEGYTKQLVLRRAREVILLADSTKMGMRSFASAGRLNQVDVLVTDTGIDDRTVRALNRRGVRVIRA